MGAQIGAERHQPRTDPFGVEPKRENRRTPIIRPLDKSLGLFVPIHGQGGICVKEKQPFPPRCRGPTLELQAPTLLPPDHARAGFLRNYACGIGRAAIADNDLADDACLIGDQQ